MLAAIYVAVSIVAVIIYWNIPYSKDTKLNDNKNKNEIGDISVESIMINDQSFNFSETMSVRIPH